MAKFHAPVIQDNPSGWGPCAVPEKFRDMPYQPFSKGDRLGKVCCHFSSSLKVQPVFVSSCYVCVFGLTGRWLDRSNLPRQEIHKWVRHCLTCSSFWDFYSLQAFCPSYFYVKIKVTGVHFMPFITHSSFLFSDKYSSQFGGGSQYAYFHEEDETSFQLVDTAKTQKTAYQRNRMRFAQVQQNFTPVSCKPERWGSDQ